MRHGMQHLEIPSSSEKREGVSVRYSNHQKGGQQSEAGGHRGFSTTEGRRRRGNSVKGYQTRAAETSSEETET